MALVVSRSKAGFSPDLESTGMWEASLENAKQPPFGTGICNIPQKHLVAGAKFSPVLAPACAAVRIGLLLSTLLTLSRLTHIL